MRHVKRNIRAISRVLVVLLIIAVVVVGALAFAWVMGYLDSSSEKEIEILSIANDSTGTDLLVYVKNVGEGAVQLDEDECLYVNGTLVSCSISGVNVSESVATLGEGETATLTYAGGAALPEEKVEVKVTAVSGVFAEKSGYPASTSPVDHFIFNTIGSPQTSGVAFSVTITALDHDDNPCGDYSGVNTLSFPGGEISPTATGNFLEGVWTGEVTLTGSASEATVTTAAQSNSSWTGTSNTFVLVATPVTWNQTYGGANGDQAYAVVKASDGGYAIAGKTSSFGAGGNDFWLVKTDASGNVEWNMTYGGTEDDSAYALVVAPDGGYSIAGYTYSFGEDDFWLVKTDASGNVEWNMTYETDVLPNRVTSLVVTSDGGYAMAGYTNPWASAFVLFKTDESGNMDWVQTYTGFTSGIANYIPTTCSMIATSDGGYALAGNSDSAGSDFWLIKTDASGNAQWNRTYGGPDCDYACSLIETSDGGYAIAGTTTSDSRIPGDFWLVKTDASGNMDWNQTYEGNARAWSLVETSDAGYAIAGTATTSTGGDDFWLVKTDASGTMEWDQIYGGPATDGAYSLIETADGGYAMAGYTDSFGAVMTDFWVVKTDEYGSIS